MWFQKPNTHLLCFQSKIFSEIKNTKIFTKYNKSEGFLLIFTEEIMFLNIEYPLVVYKQVFLCDKTLLDHSYYNKFLLNPINNRYFFKNHVVIA